MFPLLWILWMLRHPTQAFFDAVWPTCHLHKVEGDTPHVRSKRVVVLAAAGTRAQDLGRAEGQRAATSGEALVLAAEHDRKAKVHEPQNVPNIGDYKVGWFEISMANHQAVQVGQCDCHLATEGPRKISRQCRTALCRQSCPHKLVQAHTARIVHDEVDAIGGVERVHRRGHVPMRWNVLHDAQLLVQREELADVFHGGFLDHFHCNDPLILVVGLEDCTEGTASKFGLEGVAPDAAETAGFPGRPLGDTGVLGGNAL
mmetsp:Transcript_31709/g.80075  ORF Transcript_31709/g.80075 Transcript_31709/m.80075 type:complete len:258 (-) Transcript_31709:784-1557(-)